MAKDAELMGDEIVGVLLTEEQLRNVDQVKEGGDLKLRRFAHHKENIDDARFIASGEHGVVVLAVIKAQTYALKVVWSPNASYLNMLISCAV
jgi:hypothetical protein